MNPKGYSTPSGFVCTAAHSALFQRRPKSLRFPSRRLTREPAAHVGCGPARADSGDTADAVGRTARQLARLRPQTVRNSDARYKAFDVKPGDQLYLALHAPISIILMRRLPDPLQHFFGENSSIIRMRLVRGSAILSYELADVGTGWFALHKSSS
jgi:hypothetical protein